LLALRRSVHSFAVEFQQRFGYLNVLINNAGVFVPEDKLSEDGIQVCSTTVGSTHTCNVSAGLMQPGS
jgi:short-subunit dehydrogenase involved in D-alanine esterification of teichoic acids